MKKMLLGLFAVLSIASFAGPINATPQSEVKKLILQKGGPKTHKVEITSFGIKLVDPKTEKQVGNFFRFTPELFKFLGTLDKKFENINGEIKKLQDEANKIDLTEDIINIYDNIESNEKDIKDINKEIVNIHDDIDSINADIYKNKENISENKEYINQLVENDSVIHAQLREMGTEVSRNQKELQHGVAMVAAMSSLDTTSSAVGKTKISAAVGGYGADFAVALGIGRKFNDNLSVNAKLSTSTNSLKKLSYSAGISYEF